MTVQLKSNYRLSTARKQVESLAVLRIINLFAITTTAARSKNCISISITTVWLPKKTFYRLKTCHFSSNLQFNLPPPYKLQGAKNGTDLFGISHPGMDARGSGAVCFARVTLGQCQHGGQPGHRTSCEACSTSIRILLFSRLVAGMASYVEEGLKVHCWLGPQCDQHARGSGGCCTAGSAPASPCERQSLGGGGEGRREKEKRKKEKKKRLIYAVGRDDVAEKDVE